MIRSLLAFNVFHDGYDLEGNKYDISLHQRFKGQHEVTKWRSTKLIVHMFPKTSNIHQMFFASCFAGPLETCTRAGLMKIRITTVLETASRGRCRIAKVLVYFLGELSIPLQQNFDDWARKSTEFHIRCIFVMFIAFCHIQCDMKCR